MPLVGQSPRRKEGPEKLCGLAQYIDDYDLPGCLYGVTLRSSIPCGRIHEIRFDPRFPWDEIVIAGADDIPGENYVALIEKDQPLLVDKRIRHPQEPILILGHPVRQRAYEALRHIEVDYQEDEPVLDIEASLNCHRIVTPPDNLFKQFLVEKGNITTGLTEADVIVEGEYRLPYQEQAYIENNGVAAWEDEDGSLVILGSIQCPYYIHKALLPLFGRKPEKIRVIQATTGGGFGGKEEYPNMIAGHAALLAIKAGRPVKLIYDRHEDMLATTKRHPARVRHCTGVSNQGKLLAQEIEVVMDGGAYATLSSVVLSRGVLHASGPYECPNVRIVGKVVATNTPPNGAFRGFGAPQTLFAAELHMEKIAATLGKDPLALRRLNCFRVGSVTATGQKLTQSLGALEVLESAVKRGGYAKKKKEYARWNRKKTNPSLRGVGLAVVFHGAGFTGAGEDHLASRAGVSLARNGEVRVKAASTEIGQGTTSLFCQIVADTLGLAYELVRVEIPDTSKVPNSGPTVASRTCMVVGGLLHRAAQKLKQTVEQETGTFPNTRAGLRKVARKLCDGKEEVYFEAQYQKPPGLVWDEETHKGDAYGVFSYAAVVADIEIEKLTYEVRVRDLATAVDVGRAINPLFVEGQVLGGTTQALGYALLENAVYKNGVMQNAGFTNYVIPTTLDTPPLSAEILENPYSIGPFGAKGVGELPMDGPAPAIAAAVYNATGRLITSLPLLPERIYRAGND